MRRKSLFQIIVCVLIIISVFMQPISVQAADVGYIRVGLKNHYEGVSAISIKNTSVTMGYVVKKVYQRELSLTSTSGFVFQPTKAYYYAVDASYNSYKNAKTVADTIKKLGVNAYPVVFTRGKWKVYVGGVGSVAESTKVYQKIKNKFGFKYSEILKDNGHRVLVTGDNDSFIIDVNESNMYPQFSANTPNQSGVYVMNLGAYQYRGRIEIGRYQKSTLTAVNIVQLEPYLFGVVPCEISSSWPVEALKAQAVCARGFALLKAGYDSASNATKAYKMCDTTSSQVYKGYGYEMGSTNRAVNQTKGETVTANYHTVMTYFFSTSGGATESIEDVWSQTQSHARSVSDLYENKPEKAPWTISFTKEQIRSKLLQKGIDVGDVVDVYPEIKTQSGRVYSLKIVGSKDYVSLQKEAVRTTLSLYSTKFKVVKPDDNPDKVVIKGKNSSVSKNISNSYIISGDYQVKKASSSLEQYIVVSKNNRTNFPRNKPTNMGTYLFAGQGYGHGIGMSQSGARGMAEAGYNYKEILEHYFTGTKVQ